MRILHTADWHVGKRLGRFDRMEDHAAVLEQIVQIADEERVDLVLVSGDLLDRPFPPVEALRLAVETLRRLARPQRPVVAIAGNHDSPELFELLAPLLVADNVHLSGRIRRPDAGGVLELSAGGERALVACFPFLREGRVVDFMAEADRWHGQYADRVALLCRAYSDHLEQRSGGDAVTLLAAHFVVSGARLGGHGAPRGERPLHMGEAYAATEQAIPPGPQYVALGHIHNPQPVPGAGVPACYAGSTLELDFGEAGEPKRVVLVEARPGLPAEVRELRLDAGRRLVRARGTLDELLQREDLRGAFVDLTVCTDGPDPELSSRVRGELEHVVHVRAEYRREEAPAAPSRQDQPWHELYRVYFLQEHGTEPPAELLQAFVELQHDASAGEGGDASA